MKVEVSYKDVYIAATNVLNIVVPCNDEVFVCNRVLRSLFGTPSKVIKRLWEICDFGKNVQMKHMLWTLLFLKKYKTEDNMSKQLDADPKTLRKYIWTEVLPIIARNYNKLVSTFLYLVFVFV